MFKEISDDIIDPILVVNDTKSPISEINLSFLIIKLLEISIPLAA